MDNLRFWGPPPYRAAVVHGGPGAAGDMAPVAERLSKTMGVLEPFQTEPSLDGLVEELAGVLDSHGIPPVTVIGHSWGAWLSYITAARRPGLVKKLVLVSSGPFEQGYVSDIQETRLKRLWPRQREEFLQCLVILENMVSGNKDRALARLGELCRKTDSYGPVKPAARERHAVDATAFSAAMDELNALRKSGGLVELGRKIACPVTVIHGAYDPHPEEGVRVPLTKIALPFKLILLDKCGHTPWLEKKAGERFYGLLLREMIE